MSYATVHRKHLNAFGQFLARNGATLVPTKGDYEVLRATNPKRPVILVFCRAEGEILTVSKHAVEDVEAFYRERKAGGPQEPMRNGSTRMRIYVASSWRNDIQPDVVREIRAAADHEVYDFRNPAPGNLGFHWSEIDPDWKTWDVGEYRMGLKHILAAEGFELDMNALRMAEATILVLPSGRSAHLELGYAVGAGQKTAIYLPADRGIQVEPELMNKMVDEILGTMEEVRDWAEKLGGHA